MITGFYHPGFAAPIGEHIMPMRKFALVAEGLRTMAGVRLAKPAPAREDDLRRVHTAEYIAAVRTGTPRVLAESQKFPWSPALFPSVCLTNGACIAAAAPVSQNHLRLRRDQDAPEFLPSTVPRYEA